MTGRPRIYRDRGDYTTPTTTGHQAQMARLLRDELHQRGLTQREFAQQVGATEERVSLVLRGIRRADPATLDRWARTLGLTWHIELHHVTNPPHQG